MKKFLQNDLREIFSFVLISVFFLSLKSFGQILPAGNVSGQPVQAENFVYGNEWYNSSITYFKLQLNQDGIYRVTLADLQNASVVTTGLVPANLHLLRRGVEVPLYVNQTAGVLNYFEFVGYHNDGRDDSIMYRNYNTYFHDPSAQPNKNISLYTDTAAYFGYWDNIPGLRLQEYADTLAYPLTPEPTFRFDSRIDYYGGTINTSGGSQDEQYVVGNSDFTTTEGYMDSRIFGTDGGFAMVPHQITGYVNTGNPAKFQFKMAGFTTSEHHPQFNIQSIPAWSDTFSGIVLKEFSFESTTDFTSYKFGGISTEWTGFGTPIQGQPDFSKLCYISIKYDREFDIPGVTELKISDWRKNSAAYFKFTNANGNTGAVLIDVTRNQKIFGTVSGNETRFNIPADTALRNFYFASDPGIKKPLISIPRLANYSNLVDRPDFIIITNKAFANSATAYKMYRNDTANVNHWKTQVFYTDSLYDEFGYGSFTPLAIKRFLKWALDKWPHNPRFVMLWGKPAVDHRQYAARNFVPGWSDPVSDYEFVSNFYNNSFSVTPEIPIGRLALSKDEDGMNYLAKVINYEQEDQAEWMKKVVLFGGGSELSTQTVIRDILLNDFKPILEGPPMGGEVYYFQKYNSTILTNSPDKSATERINEGCGIVNFFGHSAPAVFDVDILDPSLYTNNLKNPFMIAYGCYGGNFTVDIASSGEKFTLVEEKGSIGYLANSAIGFIHALREFGIKFYQAQFGNGYGKPVGEVMKDAIFAYSKPTPGYFVDITRYNTCRQMNLQCDPSIILRFPQKTDFAIDEPDIYFENPAISAQDNEFQLNIVAHNIGSVPKDSFSVTVKRIAPDGTTVNYPEKRFAPFLYIDTLQIILPNLLGAAGSGLNDFEIFIDAREQHDEYFEDNNLVTFRQLIATNAPSPLFPPEYAIVDTNRIYLAASTYVMSQSGSLTYIFEMDTSYDFSSPFRINSGHVLGSSTWCQWDVPIDLMDNTVYYWRVRMENVYPFLWGTSSFTYRKGITGWAQSKPPQFFKDQGKQVEMDKLNQIWSFLNLEKKFSGTISPSGVPTYKLGPYSNLLSGPPAGLMYTPIRAKDLTPSIQHTLHGDWTYLSMPGASGELISEINSTPIGDYFLMESFYNGNIETWGPAVWHAMESIGCNYNELSTLEPGLYYIILGRKGYPGSALTVFHPNLNIEGYMFHNLETVLTTPHFEGNVWSTTIGPSVEWDSLFWNWHSTDMLPGDSATVSLYGIRSDGSDSLCYTGLAEGLYSVQGLDADRFPSAKLNASLKDEGYKTAPQLDQWEVHYKMAPDAAIDPNMDFFFSKDTVMEGEPIFLKLTARNLTPRNMDSLLVTFYFERADRSRYVLLTKRLAPLMGSDTLIMNLTFNTALKNLSGRTTLFAEINPGGDQPELYTFNNIWFTSFYVIADVINPALDVTFDGKHIIEGDIVSSKPEIRIQVDDENKYLPIFINDSTFQVYFGKGRTNPNLTRIEVRNNPEVEWLQVKMPGNRAGIIFRPAKLDDGEYTMKIMGQDFSGNQSGEVFYIVHFTVENRKAISNVLNYPNPFSTSTRFVYTLSGDELPDQFEIRVFTISGKLVKSIDLIETGDVHFGYNISTFTWDGKDEFGDDLANGVYVYQVITHFQSGDAIENREEDINQYFKNGFGKLYIMR